jgi:hypothetical protein
MRQDDIQIFEAYQNMHQLNEAGFASQLGANWEATKKNLSLGNIGKRVAGATARGLGAAVGGNIGQQLTQAGQSLKQQATTSGNDAKIKSILLSHQADINKLSNAIINDLNKLNLNPNGLTADVIQQGMLTQVYDNLNQQLSKTPSAPATGATPTTPQNGEQIKTPAGVNIYDAKTGQWMINGKPNPAGGQVMNAWKKSKGMP